MPFYQDSVFGPSEHSQLQRPSSVTSSPVQDRTRPAQRRSLQSPPRDEGASAGRPFRIPREVLSPAPSPIPISPTYFSYRDDDVVDDEHREEEDEDEAVEEADELEIGTVHERRPRNGQKKSAGRTSKNAAGSRRALPSSEKYLSLPRDNAPLPENGDDYEEESGRSDGPRRQGRRGEDRRHDGLVSSRPRSSPQRRKPLSSPAAAARTAAPPPVLSSSAKKNLEDEEEDSDDEDDEEEEERPARASRASPRHRDPAKSTRVGATGRDRHLRRSSSYSSTSDASVSAPSSIRPRRGKVEGHRKQRSQADPDYDDDNREKRKRRSPAAAAAAARHPSPPVEHSSPSPRKGHQKHSLSSPSMSCEACGYPLPEEMEAYLLETSAYASVPLPHCPACGSRLHPAASKEGQRAHVRNRDSREGSDDDVGEERAKERHRSTTHRTTAPAIPVPRRTPVKNQEEEVNLYSEPEVEGEEEDAYESNARERPRARANRRPAQRSPARSAPRVGSNGQTPASHHTTELVPKSPYLTLEFMPRSLASAMTETQDRRHRRDTKEAEDEEGHLTNANNRSATSRRRRSANLDHAGVPWATPGCGACCWQCGVSLAGVCCCCAMPCVLFRERQQLLFHEVGSRYICCAGAFPCCVPPVSLRPELYYTVQTKACDEPVHARRGNTASRSRPQRERYWRNAVEVSRESSSDTEEPFIDTGERRLSAPVPDPRSRFAALHSATGVASPASLVNPRTGLPLEGCYRNTITGRGTGSGFSEADGGASGYGCCDCVSCVNHTCVLDGSRGCCLSCTHPTAHCLACPLCCLCCELTCCMPCALWANRLLIRQHYNLAPDPAIDRGAACCYSCCLKCCTCQVISVVSQHHSAGRASHATSSKHVGASALSCWSQLATSVAACLAAVCCLCPCAACSLAQQRDQMERLGYPLVVEVPPEMEMM